MQHKSISVQLIILIGLFLVAGMFITYAREVYKDYKFNMEIDDLKKNIEKFKSENQQLESDLDYLDTDAYREITAKQELNLRKPGEKVFVIKDSAGNGKKSGDDENIPEYTNIPIYMKWWRMFMGKED